MHSKTFLIILVNIMLLFWASFVFGEKDPLVGWPYFYESFESRTVDVEVDDANGPWQTTLGAAYSTDCTFYVRDDITARYGSKYIDLKCTWDDPSADNCSGGFGRYGFMRANLLLVGDELEDDSGLRDNDGTEYWIAWSQFLLNDEKEQAYTTTGPFHIMYAERSYTMFWANENHSFEVVFWDKDSKQKNVHVPNDTTYWTTYKGTWVDFVMRVVLYQTDNAAAKMHLYINGDPVATGWGDGHSNMPSGSPYNYIEWVNYNWWCCGRGADCTSYLYDYYGCENTGVWEDWSRSVILDEIRVYEYTVGQGDHYCAVCPPIWPQAPTISYPTNGGTGINTTVTATYSGYIDHRGDDNQECFDRTSTEIQVDEDGGDWSTLVFTSAAAGETSQAVTGLAYGTVYQMRVRHVSLRSGTAEEYTGGWSDTVDFTTKGGEYTPPMGITNMNSGGLNVSNVNSGGITVTIR